jgi:hypothetical protein
MFKVQHRSIDETAAIYGFTFVPSPGGEPLVAGWLEPIRRYRRPPSIGRLARRRGADFDAVVFDDYALIGSDGIGRVAFIRAMCLPDGLQRRGFGREVVRQLAMIWSDEWVLEIQADASTEAGSAAFKSWGFDGPHQPTPGLSAVVPATSTRRTDVARPTNRRTADVAEAPLVG